MYSLNIDPHNPKGRPDPAEMRALGVQRVRYSYHDTSHGDQLDAGSADFFAQVANSYHKVGINSLVILTYDTLQNRPEPDAPDAEWFQYIERFARRAGQIVQRLAPWRPVIQVWNEPDHPIHPGYVPTLREAVYGQMLRRTYETVKAIDSNIRIVTAGLAAGEPAWLTRVIRSLGGFLPADIVAFHPYGQRPEASWPNPHWGFGTINNLLEGYYQAGQKRPIWITEMGVQERDLNQSQDSVAEFLTRYYRTILTDHSAKVEELFWFCYSDGMVPTFGLLDEGGGIKPAYQAFRDIAAVPKPPIDEGDGDDDDDDGDGDEDTPVTPVGELDRLHALAAYLEQRIVFGKRDNNLEHQLNVELRGVYQTLTKAQIQQLTARILAGSNFSMSAAEIDSLYALQAQKDLYGMLKAIVLAAHQRTGALTGRIGVHMRISAEAEANAITNTAAVLKILEHVQPGNRLIITDMVKANGDGSKLRAPDLFETDIYGQHRNGLIDNHAWNLQKLVRAIRNRGFQDKVLLVLRLDGPDGGANVNVLNNTSLQNYELAVWKMVRYLEASLPDVPFKLILGNEPDLPHERQWSDPHAERRSFIMDRFAPALGTFIKKLARQRPDVTFLCPALSGNMKYDYLSYYTSMFGTDRLPNVTLSVHGYASDVSVMSGTQKNLMEQQSDALRILGQFSYVSGTEIGSGNPAGDCESLSEKGYFADVVAWLLLSIDHRAPLHQDNNWHFRLDPAANDPAAHQWAGIANRSQARVLRNIRSLGGLGLQIMRGYAVDQPAYAAVYVDHNTPTTTIAGQTNAVRVTVRNTSYRTWAATGANPIRLGYRWYTADGQEVSANLWDDNRANLPHNVPPGETVVFNANLSIPRAPGAYEVRWDLVEELKTWFNWQNVPTLNVSVSANPEGDPVPPELTLNLSSNYNNRKQGEDNLLQALDNNPYTRWSTRATQTPGMWLQIDLGKAQMVNQVRLDQAQSPRDYPRGYIVSVSLDGNNWTKVAENSLNDKPVDVVFNPRQARYIRIEQTGTDPVYWWSVHQVEVTGQVTWRADASHNNVLVGEDNLNQVFDGNLQTRWSSRTPQTPDMWFELDLQETRLISGLSLNNDLRPLDYPRGYKVYVGTDGENWTEVARRDQNDVPLNVTFSPRCARYIRIEQTGSHIGLWWSIYEAVIKTEPGQARDITAELSLTARASHHNVTDGPDGLANALDGRPETRWSSNVAQAPGIWFELDLGASYPVSGLALDSAGSANDYPRGYVVQLSRDRAQWKEVSRKDQNQGQVDVTFAPYCARYIRVEQTGSVDGLWWSIHGVKVLANTSASQTPAGPAPTPTPAPTPGPPVPEPDIQVKVQSSHNSVYQGEDNLHQAIDGRPDTRWSNRGQQEPGMWFEIELSGVRTVSRVVLDNTNSPHDFPRGYIVRVSTDRQHWEEVARKDQNESSLDAKFVPRAARYIRIEQTGRSNGWWWSIHRIAVQ